MERGFILAVLVTPLCLVGSCNVQHDPSFMTAGTTVTYECASSNGHFDFELTRPDEGTTLYFRHGDKTDILRLEEDEEKLKQLGLVGEHGSSFGYAANW